MIATVLIVGISHIDGLQRIEWKIVYNYEVILPTCQVCRVFSEISVYAEAS